MSSYRYGIFLDNTYKTEFKSALKAVIITALKLLVGR